MLPMNVHPITAGLLASLYMPPPPLKLCVLLVLLPLRAQSVTMGFASWLYIPPPRREAKLLIIAQVAIVGSPFTMYSPPPRVVSCAEKSSALPAVIMKPSSTAVLSVSLPVVT